VPIPVIVGIVSAIPLSRLMKEGVSGSRGSWSPVPPVLREVLGVGVPQITGHHRLCRGPGYLYERYRRYVPIITTRFQETAMFVSDRCRADRVMLGSTFAQAIESPGHAIIGNVDT